MKAGWNFISLFISNVFLRDKSNRHVIIFRIPTINEVDIKPILG